MEMGSNLIGEDIHAKRKRVIVERLLKGREIATKLQTLINQPVEEHGLVSVEDLALQIFTSFTVTLSELGSYCDPSAQIAAVNGGGSACSSGESKKKLVGVKDRRGCYKRRKSSDSWMTVTPTMDDGYGWRKYGQKNIMNSKYPRCYYRCTHKDEGCKATKQVQILQEDPISYQTTYSNHHTCINTLIRAPQLDLDSDPIQPNLISFQLNPIINNTSLLKRESKEDDHSTQSDQDIISDDAKSSLSPWQEIIGLESWGSRPEWDPIMNSYQEEEGSGFQSCGSTSLHGLDMEVISQLGDLDNFQYFDDHIY